jgi:hypothetical protein
MSSTALDGAVDRLMPQAEAATAQDQSTIEMRALPFATARSIRSQSVA